MAIGCDRSRLEMLNLSHNRLDEVRGLVALKALIVLNLGACLFSDLPLPYPSGFEPWPCATGSNQHLRCPAL